MARTRKDETDNEKRGQKTDEDGGKNEMGRKGEKAGGKEREKERESAY